MRAVDLLIIGTTLCLLHQLSSCEQTHAARLDSYRALATRSALNEAQRKKSQPEDLRGPTGIAKLAAASSILSREDLIPCASLPARKLSTASGQTLWLDGSWSNYARPFVVKGSAQSGLCRLEIHPAGTANLNLGGRDAFVRGEQIRFLITGPHGESSFPPSNQGLVKCLPKQNYFEVSFEGVVLGKSPISYVMSESIPLDLHPRVCLARVLDETRKAMPDWVFILPTWNTVSSLSEYPIER